MAKHPTSCWLKPLTNSSKRRWNVMSAQSQKGNPALRASAFGIAGVTLLADFSGALFWEEQGLLVVSDLHLEKGSSFAARGVLLPPYDTAATLGRLAAVRARHGPRLVVALGDNFHDSAGPARMADTDRATLRTLQRGRE